MRIHLVAVGKRMPAWVASGFNEYNKRLPREFRLNLVEVAPVIRAKSTTTQKVLAEEARRIQAAIPDNAMVIALDEHGVHFDSNTLARKIQAWTQQGRDLAFIIGGADGLDAGLKQSADMLWSLSPLTLPHALTRVILAEQIYRAWTILQKHPYHRD